METKEPGRGDDETLDTFYKGRILVLQKKKGYRFSVDAPLLADFIETRPSDELLELGAGSGIVSLLLSIKPFRHVTALEIQGSLADLARRNVRLNHLESRISVLPLDLKKYAPARKFDVIFSNPPYIRSRGGQLSLSAEKSIAKHEIKCDIFDIMRRTNELLRKKGRAYFIFPERRKKDFLKAMEKNGLRLRALRPVCPRTGSPANRFLAACSLESGPTEYLPPFILYGENGEYTEEAQAVFQGRRK